MCLTPITITIKRTDEKQSVPCGKCPQCLARRISGWSFRLMQEEKISSSSYFITLTYDEKSAVRTKNNFLSLDKRHIQLFLKKLRKKNNAQLKYYCAGEYGTITMRPHYHIIMYNVDIETILPTWNMGHVDYGTVTGASIGYTLKYMCKPHKIPMHRNDDRVPEFSLMSKNWGLITSRQKCSIGIMPICLTECILT